jgi:hypothetical protein
MGYPKSIVFKLFGYEFDLMIDNVRDREKRLDEALKDLGSQLREFDPYEELKELEPLEVQQASLELDQLNFDRVFPPISSVPAKKLPTKKVSKKPTKKLVKKAPKKK